MTTSTATIAITCPPWCTSTAQSHADNLWDMGGQVIHMHAERTISDEAGITPEPLSEPVAVAPISLGLSTSTTPDNRPQGTPVIWLNGAEITVKQAEETASALLEFVTLAKEALS